MGNERSRRLRHSDFSKDLVELRLRRNPPGEIFHYTSAGGLLEIIQSNQVWATNLEFMNDFLEIKYAKQLFIELVQKERETARQKLAVPFLDHTARTFHSLTGHFSFYAISFCADGGDRLSQWRTYAHEGTGYSIGFRTTELLQTIREYRFTSREERVELIEVVYRRVDQEAIVPAYRGKGVGIGDSPALRHLKA